MNNDNSSERQIRYVVLPPASVEKLSDYLELNIDSYIERKNIAQIDKATDAIYHELCRMYSTFNEMARIDGIRTMPFHQISQIDVLNESSQIIMNNALDKLGLNTMYLSDIQREAAYSTIIKKTKFKSRIIKENEYILEIFSSFNN